MKTISLRQDVRNILTQYFNKYLTKDHEVYDIGCGTKPFAAVLQDKVRKYLGVDVDDGFYDSSYIDIIGTAYEVPVGDGFADAVISSQVLEHLEYPEKAIAETARILKQGGLFFLAFPFLYPLHAEPHDYSRITEFKIKKMLEEFGFEILEFQRIGGFWYLAGMSLGMYLQPFDRGFLKRTKMSTAFLWLFSCFFKTLHNLEGIVLRAFKKNPEIFRNKWVSNYVMVARKTNSPL